MKHSKLVAFDVDGTLIELGEDNNIWEVLSRFFKVDNRIIREMYEEFRDGKTTYEEWASKAFKQYVERGADKEKLHQATKSLKPMPGALYTLWELKKRKKKLAIISGSIDFIVKKFFPINLFDYMLINKAYFGNSGIISKFKATPYGSERYKADGLMEIAKQEGIGLDECIFVGDSYNDLEILEKAGLGIVFNPPEELKKEIQEKRRLERKFEIVEQESKDLISILSYIN